MIDKRLWAETAGHLQSTTDMPSKDCNLMAKAWLAFGLKKMDGTKEDIERLKKVLCRKTYSN